MPDATALMRITSLNIRHGGGARVGSLMEYLSRTEADTLAITEFRLGKSGQALTQSLKQAGYHHQHWTVLEVRKNAVMLASRRPFETLPLCPPIGEAHRLIAVRQAGMEIWAVYMAVGKAKLPIYDYLHGQAPETAILIGDFNTGVHYNDEKGATFIAADKFDGLTDIGWVDVWRQEQGGAAREFSWMSNAGNGFRLDHAFATPDLARRVRSCTYDHTTRPALTDHSAISVDLRPPD